MRFSVRKDNFLKYKNQYFFYKNEVNFKELFSTKRYTKKNAFKRKNHPAAEVDL